MCDPHDILNHDAFATIHLTQRTGGFSLFGSDIGHDGVVSISISRAELHRNLSNDWIHSENMPIVEVEMSHAQFAEFISGTGRGRGTPATLRIAPPRGSDVGVMPGIEKPETKHETFRREIQEMAKKRLEKMSENVRALGEMINSGKVGMKDLRALHKELERHVDQTPGSIGFVVEQAEEALEKATSDAMIQVEAFIGAAAQRIGFESLGQMAKALEDKTHEGK